MKYEEMVHMISGYIAEGENGCYVDKKWIEIMRVCKRLLEKEIQDRNERRVTGGDG